VAKQNIPQLTYIKIQNVGISSGRMRIPENKDVKVTNKPPNPCAVALSLKILTSICPVKVKMENARKANRKNKKNCNK
jgi:hypothetical protein